MRTTNHPLQPEELMAWLDGELPPDRAARAADHTATCRECQATAADLRSVSDRLLEWRIDAPPMTAPEGKLQKVYRPIERRTWLRGFAIAAPCVLLFAIASFYRMAPSRAMVVRSSLPTPRVRMQAAPAPSHAEFELAQNRRPTQTTVKEFKAPRLIAHTARLILVAANFDTARDALQPILNRHNAYIAQLTINAEQSSARSLDASLRIPDTQLDVVIAALRGLGRTLSEARGGEEVTQQSIDLDARLANARNTEARLTDLLQHRTDKLAEILAVENQISETRGDIERMEAERKTLAHRVEYAKLDVRITEEYKAQLGESRTSTWTQVRNAAVEGYTNITQSLLGVITFLLTDGPVLLLWCAILFFPVRYLWRRVQRARS